MLTFQVNPSILSLPLANTQVFPQNPRLKEPLNNNSQLQTSLLRNNALSNSSTPYDSVSAVQTLKSCTASRNLELGFSIHAIILKSGLSSNVFVNNSMLDLYTKCGCLEDAHKLFDKMPVRTVVSWTSMISGYCKNEAADADKAISIFCQMLIENECPNEFTLAAVLQACAKKAGDSLLLVRSIHCYIIKTGLVSDSFLRNSLIDAYAKSGMLADAEKLLVRFTCRDVVAWTSIISGSVLNGMMEEALIYFIRMRDDEVEPNEITILSVLHACSLINQWREIQWVHGLVIKMGLCSRNDLVLNSLVEMFVLNGYFKEGMQVFCGFCFTDEGSFLSPETIAAILQGCGHSRDIKLGKQIHGYLIKHMIFPCVVAENSLIDMYGENGESDSAYQLFSRMRNKDIISWNTMITCLVKNGEFYQALVLLEDIRKKEGDSVSPDFITMLASIQACSNLASLQLGQVIHGYTTKAGLVIDTFIQNALIDMYGRSGKLELAEKIFREMTTKDIGSWNSMISAYGINGDGTSAVEVFTKLKESGPSLHQPNAITYVNVLSACAHAGMVKEGFEIFKCIYEDGVEPSMEHYVCMVDLLGRSGRLEEAEAFIEKMPVMPGPAVWSALLSACRFYGNVEMAERAAKQISILEPESKIWRVALSNVYASVGKWEDVAMVRAEIRGLKGIGKEGGCSSIEVGGDMSKFMVNDTRHPESKMIYQVLCGMNEHIREDGVASKEKLYAIL